MTSRPTGVAILAALAGALALAGRAPAADSTATAPRPRSISYYYDAFHQSLTRSISRGVDPALAVRKLGHLHREAADVDADDQVRLPSTWWQPRLGFRPVTVSQMLRGPGPGTGPAAGKWRVIRAKTQGVSPGFTILDAEGTRFAIKLDPLGSPEMASGADVVVSKLYWAAGYNVPDNSIVTFHRADLVIDPKALVTSVSGKKETMTEGFLDRLLARGARRADGAYHAVASRILSGTALGEWTYDGRRKDDPEDLVPHQHRREIRGLWTINAWTNHTDCSARNTLDMYVKDGGRAFVRHYLIDFSGCLGSGSIAPQVIQNGHEYLLDFGAAVRNAATLGLRAPRWEHSVDPGIPAVGFIESRTFDPEHWKPFLPNPAFDERTRRDARWGARIVAAFTDEHIRAAVEQGRYTDPRATEYLVRVLIERRDALVHEWLGAESANAENRAR